MKIAIVDTYYPDFLKTFQVDEKSTYEAELQRLLDCQFGTFDAYSRNLRALGHEVIDIIGNCAPLQFMWRRENKGQPDVLAGQIEAFKPDVLFLQDLSRNLPLAAYRNGIIRVGQCSCPWPGDGNVGHLQCVFTSFPHYIPRIERLGVRAVYNPLAFEPSVLNCDIEVTHTESGEREFIRGERGHVVRDYSCVFIGGVGNPSHWRYGMEVLETVAREIKINFEWFGYGRETLSKDSALHGRFLGEAFGKDMYFVLQRSKICLNRHGEVAEGYSNNMRMFEATGCGALLLTEDSKNIRDFFTESECVTYSSPQDAVDKIRYYLDHDDERAEIAANGQKRTLRDHTYEKRMATVSTTLQEMLVHA